MTKEELSMKILMCLLDNGQIVLNYGQEFYEQGKKECRTDIKAILQDYVIVEGGINNKNLEHLENTSCLRFFVFTPYSSLRKTLIFPLD